MQVWTFKRNPGMLIKLDLWCIHVITLPSIHFSPPLLLASFQPPPCKDRKYSIGVLYMVIFNLPREVRYKQEKCYSHWFATRSYKEPSLTINSYLTPFVSELLKLWNSVQIDASTCWPASLSLFDVL